MLWFQRKPISGDGSTTTALPDELWVEIMTRLPGKEVGRCRCVCKAWRRMIGSRPFPESYRERQRGLLLYWSEIINREDGKLESRLRFFHCPFRRREEPPEEFVPLVQKSDLEAEASGRPGRSYMTQLVDGLLCVGESDCSNLGLTLHNICTGETMKIPDPLTCTYSYLTRSTFHLGYDRESREYKLLRLVIRSSFAESLEGAHIPTLRPPSGSLPLTWKVLDKDAAGLSRLSTVGIGCLKEAKAYSGDGVLCWIHSDALCDSLLCYDFSREKFRFVELPDKSTSRDFVAVTRFNDNLALWLLRRGDVRYKVVSCYVLEGEGKKWSRRSVVSCYVSKHFEEVQNFVVACRKFTGSSSSNSEMLVMDPDRLSFHYYCTQHADKEDVFFVGKLPDGAPNLHLSYRFHHWLFGIHGNKVPFFSCLVECNNLYLSLDHILAPTSATVL